MWKLRAFLALVVGGFVGTFVGYWTYQGTGDQ